MALFHSDELLLLPKVNREYGKCIAVDNRETLSTKSYVSYVTDIDGLHILQIMLFALLDSEPCHQISIVN